MQVEAFFDPTRGQRAVIKLGEGDAEAASTLRAVQDAFRARHFRRQQVERTGNATFVYGDRNQYQKLATLLTHAGLVLFLLAGAVATAASFEAVLFVGEGADRYSPIGSRATCS